MDEHNRILCADTVRRVRGETYKNQDDLYCHRYDTLLITVVNLDLFLHLQQASLTISIPTRNYTKTSIFLKST